MFSTLGEPPAFHSMKAFTRLEPIMRKKLLQNSLFAALAACALYVAQSQSVPELSQAPNLSVVYVAQR